MKKILIDTDVLLDVLLDRLSFSEHSTQILSLCETVKIKGFITPVTGSLVVSTPEIFLKMLKAM